MALIQPAPERPDFRPELVVVFESSDRFAIGLAKASLQDAGIPFWMQDDETAARLVLGPIVFPSCRFLVPKEREQEARDLVELFQPPQGDEKSR